MEKYITVILQITAICNAILLGWSVKVNGRKIILTKNIANLTGLDNDIPKLISTLLELEDDDKTTERYNSRNINNYNFHNKSIGFC